MPPREADSASASAVKAMQAEGRHPEARERYADLVARHQRRASRIAFHYLRDGAEADEAVQDAFVKAYSHLASFREELPFEVWFTRILINGCLDRIKARTRRERWLVLGARAVARAVGFHGSRRRRRPVARGSGPRARAPAEAGRRAGAAARSAALGVHAEPLRGCTSREVSALTGLNESTVRVHLFRAIRKLRTLLTDDGIGAATGGRSPEANVVSILSRTRPPTSPGRRRDCGDCGLGGRIGGDAGRAAASTPSTSKRCADCRARYDAFAGWLDDARADAHRRSRRGLPGRAARCAAGADPAPARSARTPGAGHRLPDGSRQPVTSVRRGPQRWIAAAAAAGLIVGVGAGQLLDLRRTPRLRAQPPDSRRAVSRRQPLAARAPRRHASSPVSVQLANDLVVSTTSFRTRARTSPTCRSALQRARRADAARVAATCDHGSGSYVAASQPLIFRKGLDMKEAVAGELAAAYHSASSIASGPTTTAHDAGRLTVHLAREFGFCYGVDRAVDYAYQARRRFPGRHVFLTGEIIHNPHVNDQLRAVGIRFLSDPGERCDALGPDDVVILPAFGVTVGEMLAARRARAARSSTRPAARCSTSGRTSSATRRTASPRSSTARCSTRRRRRPRRRR